MQYEYIYKACKKGTYLYNLWYQYNKQVDNWINDLYCKHVTFISQL